ncbi:MAG: ABC transporter substrate-binding protein [Candidatus Humimicrobiaceae bacterium]
MIIFRKSFNFVDLVKNNFFKNLILSTGLIFFLAFLLLTTSCENIDSPFDLNSGQDNSALFSQNNTEGAIEDEELFYKFKNNQKEKNPLVNLNIRQAIFFAIDRERIVEELFGGNNKVLNSLFSGSSFFNKPYWNKYSYDPKKARELLNMAGYNSENPLYLTIGAIDNYPSRAKIENIIKENFNEVGIKLWIENKPADEWYGSIVKKGNFELGIWSLYTYGAGELSNYLNSFKIPVNETEENKNCSNFYWYKNEKIDLLLDKISGNENIDELKTYTDEIQNMVSEDAIILPLFSRLFIVAHNKEIKNIEVSSMDGNFFKDIESWSLDNPKDGEQYTVVAGMTSEPNTLNPFFEENTSMDYINSLMLNGLWELDENAVYKPVLADEDESLPDKSEFSNTKKIKLRENIFWENGDPVTAEDVKATINAIIKDKSILKFRSDYEKIEKIEIISSKEFEIYFKENITDWKKLFLYVFPKKDLDRNDLSNLYENYIFGSGPYKFKEWEKGDHILLTMNENYHARKPFFNEIKIIFNIDGNMLAGSLKKGDIDVLSLPVDLKLIEEIKSNKKLNLIIEEGNLWEHLAVCLKTKE